MLCVHNNGNREKKLLRGYLPKNLFFFFFLFVVTSLSNDHYHPRASKYCVLRFLSTYETISLNCIRAKWIFFSFEQKEKWKTSFCLECAKGKSKREEKNAIFLSWYNMDAWWCCVVSLFTQKPKSTPKANNNAHTINRNKRKKDFFKKRTKKKKENERWRSIKPFFSVCLFVYLRKNCI